MFVVVNVCVSIVDRFDFVRPENLVLKFDQKIQVCGRIGLLTCMSY